MHEEFSVDYYNKKSADESDRVTVLEVDFYRVDLFVDWDDEDIVDLALRAVSAALGTAMINSDDILLDAAVLRARNAVSHFSPNSALYSPDVKLEDGFYICGDWVDRTGHAHLMCVKQQAGVLLLKDSIVNDGEDLLVSFRKPIMMKTRRLVIRQRLQVGTMPTHRPNCDTSDLMVMIVFSALEECLILKKE